MITREQIESRVNGIVDLRVFGEDNVIDIKSFPVDDAENAIDWREESKKFSALIDWLNENSFDHWQDVVDSPYPDCPVEYWRIDHYVVSLEV